MNPGIIFAAITALVWGFLPIKLKVALNFADAFTIVWFRFFIAFLFLFIFYLLKNRESIKILFRPPILAIIAGLGLAFNYYGYLHGIALTTPGSAQIMIVSGPMALALIGFIFFGEKINRYQVLGFLIFLLGFILFYLDKLSGISNSLTFNQGSLWVLSAGLSWALYAGLQKKLSQKYKPQELNLVFYGLSTLLYLPTVDFTQVSTFNFNQWGLMILLGLNTLIAYGCIGEALKRIPANQVGVIVTLNPLIALMAIGVITNLGYTFIAPENLSVWGISGAILFIIGAVLVISRGKRQ